MFENKIYFIGNPWPNGHLIKEGAGMSLFKNNNLIFVKLSLKSENYCLESESFSRETDWECVDSWSNYCFANLNLCEELEVDCTKFASLLTKSEFLLKATSLPINYDDLDINRNHCYILGHDDVVGHKIKLIKLENNNYNVEWSCEYVGTYFGNYEPSQNILIKLFNIEISILGF